MAHHKPELSGSRQHNSAILHNQNIRKQITAIMKTRTHSSIQHPSDDRRRRLWPLRSAPRASRLSWNSVSHDHETTPPPATTAVARGDLGWGADGLHLTALPLPGLEAEAAAVQLVTEGPPLCTGRGAPTSFCGAFLSRVFMAGSCGRALAACDSAEPVRNGCSA